MRSVLLALLAITYSDHIAPIFDKHCTSCHAPGGIAPMALTTYKEVRPWAKAIGESVKLRRMPPWFADPAHGEFANDPRLTQQEVDTIDNWVNKGAPQGATRQRPKTRQQPPAITPDLTLIAPEPIPIPAKATIEYRHLVFPPPSPTADLWVTAVQIQPSDRSVVHHAVLYARQPDDSWLRDPNTRVPTADILAIYTPGAPATVCPDGMAKKIPAGADLVLQLHYTSKKTPTADRPRIDFTFAKHPPAKRILTLQMTRADFVIPPGALNHRVSVTGTLPSEALLIGLFPHMHLRGSAFEYEILRPKGVIETLLRVKPYRFDWQLYYQLKTPRLLRKGTTLRFTGYYDNSPNNPYNPDPAAEVRWGEQSWEEMMIGFFDVAVDPAIDKPTFFDR